MAAHYQRPDWFTKHVFNRFVALATRLGISVWGSRVLRVRGRKSGEWHSTPANLLTIDKTQYLVAPRGHTQWVRNIRASGEGELLLGRRAQRFKAVEIADDQKVPILREYLKRWAFEVGMFFGGVSAAS
ncbi:MAG TPA: nitroreductase/quinone reductase family protein, partial [Candidatus Dormibacteraeota bacterium]|nr:nitroreductase/quinone reductase family protein [Candidatus Dormibacteraeota bacterium]